MTSALNDSRLIRFFVPLAPSTAGQIVPLRTLRCAKSMTS